MVDKNYNLKNTPANYPLPFTTFEIEKKKPGSFKLEQKFSTLLSIDYS